MDKLNNFKNVFIVGVGRSGTSLLQSMLASHTDIDFLPETGFLRRFWVNKKMKKYFKKFGRKRLVSILKNDKRLSRLSVNLELALAETTNGLNSVYIESISIKIFVKAHFNLRTFIGDKDPKLIEYLLFLSKIFPNSYVIHIIRDPRDVLLSKKKAKWSQSRHIWFHIFAWRVQIELGRLSLKNKNLNYFELSYEELLASPNNSLSKICEFLGLCYQSGMLRYMDKAKDLVASDELEWKKNVLLPLITDNTNNWEGVLPAREIVLTELFCRRLMEQKGYRLTKKLNSLSKWDKLWVLLAYFFLSVLISPYKFYRKFIQKNYASS